MEQELKPRRSDRELLWKVWRSMNGPHRPWMDELEDACMSGEWDNDATMHVLLQGRTQDSEARALFEAELESALCAPDWAASLAHVHNAVAYLTRTAPKP